MPYYESTYKCTLCDDVFTSKSTDKELAECKCGSNAVMAASFSEYKICDNYGHNFETLTRKTLYYKKETLSGHPDEVIKKYEECKKLAEELDFHWWSNDEKLFENEEEKGITRTCATGYYVLKNKIETNNYEINIDFEYYMDDSEKLMKKLNGIYDFLMILKNKEYDPTKRKQYNKENIGELLTERDIDWDVEEKSMEYKEVTFYI